MPARTGGRTPSLTARLPGRRSRNARCVGQVRRLKGRGACVPRPPAWPELPAMPAALERRRLDLSGVVLDPRTERCVIDGRAISLSKTEFDLLYALASNGGEVVSADHLLRAVW